MTSEPLSNYITAFLLLEINKWSWEQTIHKTNSQYSFSYQNHTVYYITIHVFVLVLQCRDFVKAGAEQGMTPSDVIQAADITFSCVADPQAAKDVSGFLNFIHYMFINSWTPGFPTRWFSTLA